MPGKLLFIALLLMVQLGTGQGRSIGNEPNSPMIRILQQASDRVYLPGEVCQPNKNA